MASLPDRPRALTEEVQAKIVELHLLGMHFSPACYAAGTTPETVKYWMKLVDAGAEHAQIYADFFGRIKEATAISEAKGLSQLKQGEQGWQAQAWFLERRFPKRWGKRERLDVNTKFDPSKMSTEELEALAKGSTKG